jgi:hypothetical protein
MKSNIIIKSLLALAITAVIGLGSAFAKDSEKDEAALAAQAKVKAAEIEKEKGVLIWSFEITTAGTQDITEVNVDATTGKIVNVEIEKPKAKGEKEDDDKD